MGRRATHPEVEDLGTYEWHITRVSDPDDEFAQKQVLTAEGWTDYHGEWTLEDVDAIGFPNRPAAEQGVELFALGYYEGSEAATAPFLGS